MKVLHVFDSFLPASQVWLANLLNHMEGIDLMICAEEYLDNALNSGFSNSIVNKGIHNTRIESDGPITKKIIKKISKKFRDPVDSVRRIIGDGEYDILHFHFAFTACDFIDVIPIDKKVFISFYGYDYEYYPLKYPEYYSLYRKLFNMPFHFICEGIHGKKILMNKGCDPEKVHVVHLGVEVDKIPFAPRDKSPGKLKLIQIADFREKKGQLVTVKSFHHALEKNKNIHLTFVGRDKGYGYIKVVKRYVSEHELEDHVKFIAQIDYNTLHQFLTEFDVFIHPSQYAKDRDCEGGAPIVLLDAQATGLPVISTKHCDIPEEVKDGITGLLSEEGDINSIAKSILDFTNMTKEDLAGFAIRGRRHVEQHFDIAKSGLALVKLYKR